MNRRTFLSISAASFGFSNEALATTMGTFEITRTDAQWRAMLTPLEYKVMRQEGTERAFTSPLDKFYEAGLYHCRGCDLALYSSDHKYDSGTGWPSFWQAQEGAIGTSVDRKFFMVRTECHCARCGSHLGHIFEDGPQPTGLRHCINGVSLVFKAT